MSRKKNHVRKKADTPDPASPRWGRRIFLRFLATVGAVYALILGYHLAVPRQSVDAREGFLENCRELCLSYGIIPTGHIANDARAYLDAALPEKLSSSLAEILADDQFVIAASQPHPLLGQTAPDFKLPNDRGEFVDLHTLTSKGPVIVVFYYGYGCSHCVAQLFGLQKDLKHLRELGAEVVAISSDSPAHTAEKFEEYGRFDFPVLSDQDQKVAREFGTYIPSTEDRSEDLKHGTFLLDRTGTVQFAQLGYQPFLDNKSLLFWLAEKRPELPVTRVGQQAITGEVK